MLSNYRPGRSLSVSAGVSGSYNHPAGVANAIKGKVKKKTSPAAGIFLLSQPTSLSRICSDLPRHVLTETAKTATYTNQFSIRHFRDLSPELLEVELSKTNTHWKISKLGGF